MERLWRLMPAIGVTVAVALLLAGIVLAFYNERAYLAQKTSEATVQAQILAATVTAALAFNDRPAAQEYVNAMAANPEIRAAGIYDERQELFVSFARSGEPPLPATAPALGSLLNGDRLILTTPVLQGNTAVGSVSLQVITEPLARRLQRYAAIAVLATMASLVFGVLVAAHAALSHANAELRSRAGELARANRDLETQMAEREKAEEALRRAQRIEAVGQLTAGIAHDFNNLLTAVIGNLEMLSLRMSGDDRSRRMIAAAQKAAERGAKLTSQLLAFSRRQRLAPQPVDLNDIVRGLSDVLRTTVGATATIEINLAPGIPVALADPSQVEQILLNLAINARDAMTGGGMIAIETGFEQLGEPARPEEPPAGDYALIRVRDTGTGIGPEILDRVFEPFFTTKDVGKGSGLGLSQVVGIAQQLGGGVRIRTTVGEGTTVEVFLPPALGAPEAAVPEAAEIAPSPRSWSSAALLVVDDDADVRAVTAATLREAGHAVIERDSGSAALEVFARREQKIALLIADFAMPGMNGVELARKARQFVPNLPVVFVTGYADTATLAAYAMPEEVLQKPFRAGDLLARVGRALRTASAPVIDPPAAGS